MRSCRVRRPEANINRLFRSILPLWLCPRNERTPTKATCHHLGEISPALSDTPLAGTTVYCNLCSPHSGRSVRGGSGSSAAQSPANRPVGEEGLLDGEYGIVYTRKARAATEQGSYYAPSSFSGTFNPIYGNAAANAARAAAAAALDLHRSADLVRSVLLHWPSQAGQSGVGSPLQLHRPCHPIGPYGLRLQPHPARITIVRGPCLQLNLGLIG